MPRGKGNSGGRKRGRALPPRPPKQRFQLAPLHPPPRQVRGEAGMGTWGQGDNQREPWPRLEDTGRREEPATDTASS